MPAQIVSSARFVVPTLASVPPGDSAKVQPAYFLIRETRSIALAPGSYVIGRGSEADILFDRDLKLSRQHARLVVSEDGVDVEDLGSTNGTWVNSYLVQHRLRVTGRAKLRIGDVDLLLEPAAGRGPVLKSTLPDGKRVKIPPAEQDLPTEQTAAFEVSETALRGLLERGRLGEAKQMLSPILAMIEVGRADPEMGAVEVYSEIAFRVGLAACDASYVDAAMRLHCAHAVVMSDLNLQLLSQCVGSGLEPDPRNVEVYLAALGEKPELASQRERLRDALAGPTTTMPAPPISGQSDS